MKIKECIEKVKQSGIKDLSAYVAVKCDDGVVTFGSKGDSGATVVLTVKQIKTQECLD